MVIRQGWLTVPENTMNLFLQVNTDSLTGIVTEQIQPAPRTSTISAGSQHFNGRISGETIKFHVKSRHTLS